MTRMECQSIRGATGRLIGSWNVGFSLDVSVVIEIISSHDRRQDEPLTLLSRTCC